MKVVAATRGGDMLLLIRGESLKAALVDEDNSRGRVLWISEQLLGSPKPLYRLLETRPWEDAELADEELQKLLQGVTVQGPPIDAPWVY
jgi:hypothetical protein